MKSWKKNYSLPSLVEFLLWQFVNAAECTFHEEPVRPHQPNISLPSKDNLAPRRPRKGCVLLGRCLAPSPIFSRNSKTLYHKLDIKPILFSNKCLKMQFFVVFFSLNTKSLYASHSHKNYITCSADIGSFKWFILISPIKIKPLVWSGWN